MFSVQKIKKKQKEAEVILSQSWDHKHKYIKFNKKNRSRDGETKIDEKWLMN